MSRIIVKFSYKAVEKQEGHDGPEIAHLYIGPWPMQILNQGLLFEQTL
jgi:hypothetical protein